MTMTVPTSLSTETIRIYERACLRKEPMTRRDAMRSARRLRARRGDPVDPYSCPFADDDHWHVGHPLSLEGLEALATAVREFHGNAPDAPTPT